MTRWNSLTGHKGDNLENLITQVNSIYDRNGLALVTKIPVPIKVLRILKGKIVEAFFEEKSILDFQGIIQGNPVTFDAKETKENYLPLKNIHTHQIKFMEKFDKQKGLAFIFCHFTTHDRFFLIPVDTICEYYYNSLKGDRKSIPIESLDSKYEIQTKNGLPFYLEALELYRQYKIQQWKKCA